MSRISELEFYNDKDVITQIEWLKDHIGADHIKNITIEENTDPASPDFGKTKITMFMENGEYYEGSFTSALIKSVDSHQEGDEVVLEFHLATGETITARCKVIVHATASWDSLEGDPKSSVSLTEWMNTKTETTDFTNEVTARVQGDEKNASAITALDRNLSDKIAEIGTEVAKKENVDNKVSEWQETPDDEHYPSEKLTHDAINTLTSRINESRTSHTTVETGVEQMRVFFDNPDSKNVVKGYVFIVLKVDKYFENSTATYYNAKMKLSSNRGLEIDAADWNTHFKSYNGVSYIAEFNAEGGWYLKREDGQPIGTDRLSVTLMIQGKERRLS